MSNNAKSHAVMVKHGARETETLLIEGDGLALMYNLDGGIVLELYRDAARSNSLRVRLSPDDVQSQAHVLRKWARGG